MDPGYMGPDPLGPGSLDSNTLNSDYLGLGPLGSGNLEPDYLDSGYLDSGYLDSGYLGSGYMDSGYLDSGYLGPDDFDPDNLGAASLATGMSLQYSDPLSRAEFVDEGGEQRVFNPHSLRLDPATVESLAVYDALAGITHTRFLVVSEHEPRVDTQTLLVCVSGVSRDGHDGTPGSAASAAIGVYFGPDSPHNYASRIPPSLPQTSRFAEIFAVRIALLRVRGRWRNGNTVSTVHIVTDSEYVVKALSENIGGWRANRFQNAQGENAANHSEIEKLDLLMLELAEDGVDASFWPVNRMENEEAYSLARGALGLLPH